MKSYKSIWKDVKPFSYPQKGADSCFNYGYRYKYRKPEQKLQKRKVYRQYRKLGFDASETWNLCDTIMRYLSDNVGGFFRKCGNADDWFDENTSSKEAVTLEDLRIESYKQHLEEYLSTTQDYHKFLDFVIPRLLYFTKHRCCYPCMCDSDDKWEKILKEMMENLVNSDYNLFVKYFFCLWD
jgi:hypothetical protein